MSAEQKKPNTDEVSEEQLDEVTGGIFPASSNSDGTSISFPDVCMTPTTSSPTPTPYPNVSGTTDGTPTTKPVTTLKSVETKEDSP